MRQLTLLMTGAAALLVGCAGPMGTLRPGPSVPADQAQSAEQAKPPVTAFDGSYRNTIRLVSAFGSAEGTPWCYSPGQPVIVVKEGQFSYSLPHPNVPGDATPAFPAAVAADGSFSGQIIWGSISGQIRDGHIEGRIDGSACIYAFAGDRT